MTLMTINRVPAAFREFDEFWRAYGSQYNGKAPDGEQFIAPSVDIVESDKYVELILDMPGVDPAKIDVKVEGNVLTISAERLDTVQGREQLRQERTVGKYGRSFTLPNRLDGASPDAVYKNGVLAIVLPKKEEAQPKTLKVRVAA